MIDGVSRRAQAEDADELRGARPLAALRVCHTLANSHPHLTLQRTLTPALALTPTLRRALALALALTLPLYRMKAYHALFGVDEARKLIDEFGDSRNAAVANSEALRKLVKKYDKVRSTQYAVRSTQYAVSG